MNKNFYQAKQKDNGEWIRGYIVKYGYSGKEKWHIIPYYASDLYSIEIDENTISQYTGMDTIMGQPVFENDLIKDEQGNMYKVFWKENHSNFSCECIKTEYTTLLNHIWDLYVVLRDRSCEVIGNIFDNFELLGV